jgi:predicted peptidase
MRRLQFALFYCLLIGCGGQDPVAIPEAAELKKLPPGTHQETADIPSLGSVKFTIEIPDSYGGKTPTPLVLALHYGYDGAKPDPFTGGEMIAAFRAGLSRLNAVVIAPDALGGSWTDARNEKAAVWLVNSAMKSYAIDKRKVIITGYSLGGEGTWFIGGRHQDLFTGAIPVAAPIPPGSETWKIPVYVIHSDKDQIVSYTAAKKHADAVKTSGIRVEFKTVNGLSHYQTTAYAPYVGEAIRWLEAEWNK